MDGARERWIKRLIDLSRRNNLLFFRHLKTGTLDLSDGDPKGIESLIRGERMKLRELLDENELVQASACIREIQRRAVSNFEERGLETLYLAVGMAMWPVPDGGRPTEAPVFLVPVGIESKGRETVNVALQRAGEIQFNEVLRHVLEREHDISLSPELLAGSDDETGVEDSILSRESFQRLESACQSIPGLDIAPRFCLGNFSFQKMAIVKEIQECAEDLAQHDLIAAIAGDDDARAAISERRHSIDPHTLDDRSPDSEFLVLDADSSQQVVIAGALAGQDGVIQGPPGTGKSQTIANLIAQLAASGKRVLFVAEKRAALDVVLERLRGLGLGHLALDLHGAEVTRRQIVTQLADSLRVVRESAPVVTDEAHNEFVRAREQLVGHARLVYEECPPTGLSLLEMEGQLLRLPVESSGDVRWRGRELEQLDDQRRRDVETLLLEASEFASLLLREDPSPWTGANLPDGRTVQEVSDRARRIAGKHFPELLKTLDELGSGTGLPVPETIDELARVIDLISRAGELSKLYHRRLFQDNPRLLAAELEPARSLATRFWAWLTRSGYRSAVRRMQELRVGPTPPARELLDDAAEAADLLDDWKAETSGKRGPIAWSEAGRLKVRERHLMEDHQRISNRLSKAHRETTGLRALWNRYQQLASDLDTAQRIPRLMEIEGQLSAPGLTPIFESIREIRPHARLWPLIFRHAWLMSWIEHVWAQKPALAAFNGRTHDRIANEFRRLDRDRIDLAVQRVRRAHAENAIDAMNRFEPAAALIRREALKKSRHLPLRRLVQDAGEVLTALKPCWMASPLSVSQLLPSDRSFFDVVLFDEASQILPEDAVTSLLRAQHAIVAGDRHQLPPTTFFAAFAEEVDEETAASEGFESLLDLMTAFCEPWTLDWHYRSRDESLIAFSNHHIYRDRLVTFPAASETAVLRHELVEQVDRRDGEEDSAPTEVRRVVELVLQHAAQRPEESLGVIAMGIKHAVRVEALLDQTLKGRPELDPFFDESRRERFFVKNLERVQGDERDAIILTIGYGKDRSGRLPYRFGPLLYEGGERRLNVAVTRARNRLTLVSSFGHHDMDPDRTRARGVELLRHYLQYASSGGTVLGDRGRTETQLNDFEQDIHDALRTAGIPLIPQWGSSRYRIDLAAKHPTKPGRFVLAIECDGATYHSAPTARDRDRLRQQHLEALGWRFHRIWSTDWFLRRSDEIQRARDAYESAVAHSDNSRRVVDAS